MKRSDNTATYLQMGMASLIPGMQYMIERMQAELDLMRAQLAAVQNGDAPRRGRPPKSADKAAGGRASAHSQWSGMTAEERSAEMKRRFKVRRKNQAAAARAKKLPSVKLTAAAAARGHVNGKAVAA